MTKKQIISIWVYWHFFQADICNTRLKNVLYSLKIFSASLFNFFLCYPPVLEYIEGNPISNIRRMTTRIGETTARSYFKDIISGLIYLHSHVCCLFLKLRSILFLISASILFVDSQPMLNLTEYYPWGYKT